MGGSVAEDRNHTQTTSVVVVVVGTTVVLLVVILMEHGRGGVEVHTLNRLQEPQMLM